MKDYATLGSLMFEFDSELPVPWREKDILFMDGHDGGKPKVYVKITAVDELPEQIGRKFFSNDSCEFRFTEDGLEIRDYWAMYLPGHPHYARSIWDGKVLNVLYRRGTGVWENPNFRIWNVLHLENHLLAADALVLHCCWLEHDGEGILLTAPSGTGKTTHGKLWQKCFDAQIVNGDKALIQRVDNQWLVQGYPFHGSALECENRTMPIKAIVILRQGKENRIEELSPIKKVKLLLSETTVNFFSQKRVNAALDLVTDLIGQNKVVMYHCTMEEDAAYTLHNYLYTEGS